MPLKNCLLKAFLIILSIALCAQNAPAGPTPLPAVKVQLDGRELTFDVSPLIENGRTLVPLRGIAEALGAAVNWEEKTRTVIIQKGGVTVKLTIGSKVALKNQEKITLDVPAKIIGDRTVVPLRFVSEALGANVRWDPAARLVSLNRPTTEEKPEQKLVVQGDAVNIRSGPGTSHDVLAQVSRGARLPFIDRSADWYQVQLPDGKTGWIIAWYVKEEVPPATSPEPEKPGPIIPVPDPEKNNGTGGKSASPAGPPAGNKAEDNKGNGNNGDNVENNGGGDKEGSIENKESEQNQETNPDVGRGGVERGEEGQSPVIELAVTSKDEQTRVEVTCTQKVTYHVFRLRDPDRLVMDIQGVRPGDLPASQAIDTKTVSTLRIGWFSREPDITRLVFDLKDQVLYRVEISPDQKKIVLDIFLPNIKDAFKGVTIVLDPGHGGADPGAIGRTLGLQEKVINYDVARRAAGLLTAYGARVVLTRSGDYEVDLYARPEKANSAGADLFVSIHMNANTSTQLSGTTTYYARSSANGAERLVKSRRLAEHLQSALVSTLRLEDKGVRQADFVVIREAAMPAVLIEAAFLSNPAEERLMATEQFRENTARAIVQGIGAYLIDQQNAS
ncbi:MAG: N-acetylmuramoyl-L-alanine amidase [Armatimonadetes bacterium]|nr:N-acetylmuramoyl-L-alanine amidase [Armatimonadota bacterium]